MKLDKNIVIIIVGVVLLAILLYVYRCRCLERESLYGRRGCGCAMGGCPCRNPGGCPCLVGGNCPCKRASRCLCH